MEIVVFDILNLPKQDEEDSGIEVCVLPGQVYDLSVSRSMARDLSLHFSFRQFHAILHFSF
jgi:hypothetical protein